MKDKIFGILQRVGRSFMLPIAILPIAGLFLGIGSSFTNPTTLEAYHLTSVIFEGGILYTILEVMSETGSVVFDNLAFLFAIGVAIGMAKKEKEVAALSGAIGYLIMNTAIGSLIYARGGIEDMPINSTTTTLGIPTLQMGVFGGILVGLGVAALHNRFYKINLPQVLSFFGGTRFVPIITSVVFLIVGIMMFFLWPFVQGAIAGLGQLVLQSGYLGTWIYGTMERALIPFGLHHVFYMPFWQTELGGSMVIDDTLIKGAQNIFFAQLASKSTKQFSVSATRFMAGKFPFMIFGLPAGAYAMYKAARPEKKKVVGGLLLSAALTSMITGITEPLEFTFLFVAPLMYAMHCILAGLSYMLMHIFSVGVGMTFSGGLIDLFLFGVLQGNRKTNWIWIPVIGIAYALVYYYVFYYMIIKLQLKTPGRESDQEETKLYTRKDVNQKQRTLHESEPDRISIMIANGLGGKNNISDIDCCATRLRVTVKKPEMVQDSLLKASGASGVIHKGNGVQIVFGPQVANIKSNLEDFLESEAYQENFNEETNALAYDAFEPSTKKTDKQSSLPPNDIISGKENKHLGEQLYAHMNGKVIPLEELSDEVFSSKALGDGIAVEPNEGILYAPCDGRVETVFDTKHAITLQSVKGCEILLHIGIDTVKLGGEYFRSHVTQGQEISKGDVLISFDQKKISDAGYQLVTPMIVCNTDDYKSITILHKGKISVKEEILEIR